ncbi:MAG: ORC1-type DNA replication protein, partial [Candidatus Odinarchaeia archaeon]
LEEELKRSTIFKDETKLSVYYVPEKLPHREREIKILAKIFRPFLEKPGLASPMVFITGNTGCGKTSVTQRFGQLAENLAKKRGIKLKYVHINCRREKTDFLILLQLAKAITPNIPKRGFSAAELLQIIIELLEKKELFILLTLDEVDYLIRKGGEDLIYDLTRLNDDILNGTARLSLILISKDETVKFLLDESILSLISNNTLKFKPYTAHQLADILKLRADEAFYPSTISPGVIELIADIAAEWGDARYALELLWRAGRYADEEKVLRVFPEHVRKAKYETHPELRKELLNYLTKQEKITLLAIVRALKKERTAYVRIGDVEKIYQIICEEYGEEKRGHTQLWERIKTLNSNGIIKTGISSKGIRGKTTLIWLGEVPVEVLEKELISLLKGGGSK